MDVANSFISFQRNKTIGLKNRSMIARVGMRESMTIKEEYEGLLGG